MRQTPNSLITMAALVAGMSLAPATRLEAQQTAVGVGRAELRSTLGIEVPYRLALRASEHVTVVEQTADFKVVEIRLVAASNARWRMDVASEAGEIEVQSETGEWSRAAEGVSAPVVLIRAPSNPTEVVVRLRIPRTSTGQRPVRANFQIRPVAVDQGAVSVSWVTSE